MAKIRNSQQFIKKQNSGEMVTKMVPKWVPSLLRETNLAWTYTCTSLCLQKISLIQVKLKKSWKKTDTRTEKNPNSIKQQILLSGFKEDDNGTTALDNSSKSY